MNVGKRIVSAIYKHLVALLSAALLVFSVSSLQAVYQAPYANPPNGNRDAPVHLGTDFQDMTGGLEADGIGVTYGISLNGINRTAAQGFASLSTGSATCHLEVRRVDITTGTRTFAWDDGVSLSQYPICDDYLTAQAKSEGWGSTGLDNCLGTDGYQCGSSHRPSSCVFTRLVCAGIAVSPSLISTSTYAGGAIALPINSTSTYPL
jgi:hypothetical protein